MKVLFSSFIVAVMALLLPVSGIAQMPEYTFSSESLLDNQCVDTPPLGDGFGWDGICTCHTSRADLPYDWNAIELIDGQLIATNSQAPGTCAGSGSLSVFDWRGDEPPIKTQELISSVRSSNDTFGLIDGGGLRGATFTNTGTRVVVTNGIIAVRSSAGDGAIVTIFRRNEEQWLEDIVLSPVLQNRGRYGRHMVFLNEQQLLIDEDDALFIYNTSDWSISQEIPISARSILGLESIAEGFVLHRTLSNDARTSSKVDYFVKEGGLYRNKQSMDGGFSAVSEKYMVSSVRGPLSLQRSLTITTRELDSSGLWVDLPDATIAFETSSVFDRVHLVGNQLVLSTLEQDGIQIYNLGSAKTWELVQQINVDNIEACDSWCGFSRDFEVENGNIIVKNYTRNFDDNLIAFTIYSQNNSGLWTELTTINFVEAQEDNGYAFRMRFSLIGDNYALAELPTQSSDRATVGIYNINLDSSNTGSTPDSSTDVTPTDMVGGCDYRDAVLTGGWGWNETTRESCAPLSEMVELVTPQVPAGCDYRDAALTGGWGWNETTRESCAPMSESGETVDQVSTHVPGCDYSNAALSGGWGWNETTRESCAPLSESSEMVEQETAQMPVGCDYSSAALSGGWGWNETTRESCAPL